MYLQNSVLEDMEDAKQTHLAIRMPSFCNTNDHTFFLQPASQCGDLERQYSEINPVLLLQVCTEDCGGLLSAFGARGGYLPRTE